MNRYSLIKYLATGEYVQTEDAAPKKSTTLAAHDKRFHPNGYKEGDSCKFRDAMAKGDSVDKIFEAEEIERDRRDTRMKLDEEERRKLLLDDYKADGNAILDEKRCAKARDVYYSGLNRKEKENSGAWWAGFKNAATLASGLDLFSGGYYTHPSGDPIDRSWIKGLAFYGYNRSPKGKIPQDFGPDAVKTYQENIIQDADYIIGVGGFDRFLDTLRGIKYAADIFGIDVGSTAKDVEDIAKLNELAKDAVRPLIRLSINNASEKDTKAAHTAYNKGMSEIRNTASKWDRSKIALAGKLFETLKENEPLVGLRYTARAYDSISKMMQQLAMGK